jgi:hypothetical protein
MRLVVAAFLSVLVLGSAVLAGDMQVIESNVEKYPVGAVLPETEVLKDMPPDGRVRVLILSSQVTRVYDGKRGGRAGAVGGARGIRN